MSAAKAVLLVDDNPDDVFLMERIFLKQKLGAVLKVTTDGKQALDYLTGKDSYSNRLDYPVPDLVFLDLKLPFLNGFEVLEQMRQKESLVEIPVVILSSSLEDRDRDQARSFNVPYLVKPPSLNAILPFIEKL
jgi:CheY-like chemotaxis protein